MPDAPLLRPSHPGRVSRLRRRAVCLVAASALALGGGAARADVPRIVTDIAPVQGLVSMVLGDLGTASVLIDGAASPHGFALRPSQARALSEADIVVWIGPSLTPGLGDRIETLAVDAHHLALEQAQNALRLPFREGGLFAHDHGDEDHGHDDHAHDDHGLDAHDDHAHDDHAEAGHTDPHLWLDPGNARLWLGLIAAKLAEADPDNADTYRANAETGAAAITEAETEAAAMLAPVTDAPLGVAHDAYQYFEAAFGLTVVGALSDGDDAAPGAARLDRLKDALAETPPVCYLAEPGTDPALLEAVAPADGAALRLADLDPLGSALPAGAGHYPALIRDLATRIVACVDGAS